MSAWSLSRTSFQYYPGGAETGVVRPEHHRSCIVQGGESGIKAREGVPGDAGRTTQEAQVKASNAKKKQNGSASVAATAATTEDTNLAILEHLSKLATSNEQLAAQMQKRESEMADMKTEFEQLKKSLGNNNGGGGSGVGGGFRRAPPKCPVCQVSGAFCKHCAHCGKNGHKIKDCPEKN